MSNRPDSPEHDPLTQVDPESRSILAERFVERRSGARRVFLARTHAEPLERLGFVEGRARCEPSRMLRGRGSHPVYPLPGHDGEVLWKRCVRGGWLHPLLKDRHLSIDRFLREVVLSARALAAGVAVAEPLALACVDTPAGWKRVELAYKVIEDSQDLAAALLDARLDARDRRALLRATAVSLRRFHGLGFTHGDLNLKNILWQRQATGRFGITLIDLDPGARLRERFQTPERNLLRLFRSYAKGARAGRWRVSRSDLHAFLASYFHDDRRQVAHLWRRARRKSRGWDLLDLGLLRARAGAGPRREAVSI